MEGIRQLKEYLRAPQLCSEEKVRCVLGDAGQLKALTALLQRQPQFDPDNCEIVLSAVIMENGSAACELDCESLRDFLRDVGEVTSVVREGENFRATFATAVQAQLAFYAYNDLELPELGLRLLAARSPATQPSAESPRPTHAPEPSPSAAPNKFTCRYDINIENDRQFEVSKRIIGTQGCNMKTILQSVQRETFCKEKDVKLRLRGRGSNFQEGPERRECDDKLHLCVSTKTKPVFDSACAHVEKLLEQVFEEYAALLHKTRGGGPALNLSRHRFHRTELK